MKSVEYEVRETSKASDSDDILFFSNGERIYGFGFRGKKKGDTICLLKCPSCNSENYTMAVSSGQCAFCGFDANKCNQIISNGVDKFRENFSPSVEELKKKTLTMGELLESEMAHEKYHGENRPGCILVVKRRERTYQEHYLDIYTCLTHGTHLECLRGGWEIGWCGGTNSRAL